MKKKESDHLQIGHQTKQHRKKNTTNRYISSEEYKKLIKNHEEYKDEQKTEKKNEENGITPRSKRKAVATHEMFMNKTKRKTQQTIKKDKKPKKKKKSTLKSPLPQQDFDLEAYKSKFFQFWSAELPSHAVKKEDEMAIQFSIEDEGGKDLKIPKLNLQKNLICLMLPSINILQLLNDENCTRLLYTLWESTVHIPLRPNNVTKRVFISLVAALYVSFFPLTIGATLDLANRQALSDWMVVSNGALSIHENQFYLYFIEDWILVHCETRSTNEARFFLEWTLDAVYVSTNKFPNILQRHINRDYVKIFCFHEQQKDKNQEDEDDEHEDTSLWYRDIQESARSIAAMYPDTHRSQLSDFPEETPESRQKKPIIKKKKLRPKTPDYARIQNRLLNLNISRSKQVKEKLEENEFSIDKSDFNEMLEYLKNKSALKSFMRLLKQGDGYELEKTIFERMCANLKFSNHEPGESSMDPEDIRPLISETLRVDNRNSDVAARSLFAMLDQKVIPVEYQGMMKRLQVLNANQLDQLLGNASRKSSKIVLDFGDVYPSYQEPPNMESISKQRRVLKTMKKISKSTPKKKIKRKEPLTQMLQYASGGGQGIVPIGAGQRRAFVHHSTEDDTHWQSMVVQGKVVTAKRHSILDIPEGIEQIPYDYDEQFPALSSRPSTASTLIRGESASDVRPSSAATNRSKISVISSSRTHLRHQREVENLALMDDPKMISPRDQMALHSARDDATFYEEGQIDLDDLSETDHIEGDDLSSYNGSRPSSSTHRPASSKIRKPNSQADHQPHTARASIVSEVSDFSLFSNEELPEVDDDSFFDTDSETASVRPLPEKQDPTSPKIMFKGKEVKTFKVDRPIHNPFSSSRSHTSYMSTPERSSWFRSPPASTRPSKPSTATTSRHTRHTSTKKSISSKSHSKMTPVDRPASSMSQSSTASRQMWEKLSGLSTKKKKRISLNTTKVSSMQSIKHSFS
mmetsp:Transcript_11476/g.16972  ORF Transcript_11476/g.16972 Transcript_11476/m.16972 type:complete len:974 (-) Transcript_11476:32-2953(-)